MGKRNKIAMIMPYFGKWPEWIDLFFYSCRKNDFIDFHVFTDCSRPAQLPDNVIYVEMKWEDYCDRVSKTLHIEFSSHHKPYKLCDCRPFYGLIHEERLKEYDFWGYGDFDLCYGNLREWLTDKILTKYDVFSTHANRLSGHFCLIRNNSKYRTAALSFKNWRKRICDTKVYGFDEYDFTEYFIPNIHWAHRLHRYIGKFCHIGHYKFFSLIMPFLIFGRRLYFKELQTTTLPKDTQEWKYNLETGTMQSPKNKELPYLHFLFFKKTPFCETNKYWKSNFYQVSQEYLNGYLGNIIISNLGIREDYNIHQNV